MRGSVIYFLPAFKSEISQDERYNRQDDICWGVALFWTVDKDGHGHDDQAVIYVPQAVLVGRAERLAFNFLEIDGCSHMFLLITINNFVLQRYLYNTVNIIGLSRGKIIGFNIVLGEHKQGCHTL